MYLPPPPPLLQTLPLMKTLLPFHPIKIYPHLPLVLESEEKNNEYGLYFTVTMTFQFYFMYMYIHQSVRYRWGNVLDLPGTLSFVYQRHHHTVVYHFHRQVVCPNHLHGNQMNNPVKRNKKLWIILEKRNWFWLEKKNLWSIQINSHRRTETVFKRKFILYNC